MITTTVDEAKSMLADLIDAAMRGEDVYIRSGGDRTAQIVVAKSKSARPQFGSAKGRIEIADDFEAPLADFVEYQ
jgi:antitoxin (DNA-binding transcriptional repressor) of toxin-antitoxin stability system